jgi:hypothetical protein
MFHQGMRESTIDDFDWNETETFILTETSPVGWAKP